MIEIYFRIKGFFCPAIGLRTTKAIFEFEIHPFKWSVYDHSQKGCFMYGFGPFYMMYASPSP